jgi:hypothetical protein
MTIRSPFSGQKLPTELVCEFFAVFSRFEFAIKEDGYVQNGKRRAQPDWDEFAARAPSWLRADRSDTAAAVDYLTGDPPQVQNPDLSWEPAPLAGGTPIEQALHAVTRVRNNLFHGGKHTPHSPPGRDERLIRASLLLLYACLEQNANLKTTYEETEF